MPEVYWIITGSLDRTVGSFGFVEIARIEKFVPLVEADDLAQFSTAGFERLRSGQHRIAPEFPHDLHA